MIIKYSKNVQNERCKKKFILIILNHLQNQMNSLRSSVGGFQTNVSILKKSWARKFFAYRIEFNKRSDEINNRLKTSSKLSFLEHFLAYLSLFTVKHLFIVTWASSDMQKSKLNHSWTVDHYFMNAYSLVVPKVQLQIKFRCYMTILLQQKLNCYVKTYWQYCRHLNFPHLISKYQLSDRVFLDIHALFPVLDHIRHFFVCSSSLSFFTSSLYEMCNKHSKYLIQKWRMSTETERRFINVNFLDLIQLMSDVYLHR